MGGLSAGRVSSPAETAACGLSWARAEVGAPGLRAEFGGAMLLSGRVPFGHRRSSARAGC
jgi:hypothetical protein